MDTLPCPDGYLLDPSGPLADGHHLLNEYLVDFEEVGWKAASNRIGAVRDKQRKLLAWRALLERLCWLHLNNPASQSMEPLRGLLFGIEKWTLSPGESDFFEILDRTAAVAGFAEPYTPLPHLMIYTEKNGLSQELSAAIRSFRQRLGRSFYKVNQTRVQLLGSRLDMLAWRDQSTAIDLKRCWSERLRASLRVMSGGDHENWRRVLFSIHGAEGTRPAPRWLIEMRVAINRIGAENFSEKLRNWFQSLERGTTQPLSREGSYLLRSLIWLAAYTRDPALLERVDEIREVSFRPVSNGQKVLRAAAEAVQPRPEIRQKP